MGKQADARREACSDNDSMVLDDVKFYLANETCRNKKLLLSYSVEQ
jgi:hypothetical protein